MGLALCAAAAGGAPGRNGAAARAPPVAAVSFRSSRRVGSKVVTVTYLESEYEGTDARGGTLLQEWSVLLSC